jgi:glycosyltransferase involved in cell wall biosynthesis
MSRPTSSASRVTPPPELVPVPVLHISGRSDHGGGPEHIRQVISAAIPGIRHHIACPAGGLYWQRYAEQLGAERLCAIPHRSLSLSALLRLRGFVRDQGIRVLHSHGMSGGVYGRTLGLLTGLPVLHSFHGVPVTPGFKHRLNQAAEHILSRLTDCGIAVSAGEADIVHARWRRYRGRLAVVPNGIDIGSDPPPWAPWPPSGTLRIVSFSRYNHQKHPELLIEIARCLHLRGLDFRIDAYGEGLGHPSLSTEALRRGVADRLRFHPPTDAPVEALAGAHIYLSTSRWEGMPLAVLEAWRSGLVVVASDVVGNRDLIEDGRTGRLFPHGDGRAAARAIDALVTALEPAERIRRHAARFADRHHTHDLMALRLSWLYQHGVHAHAMPSGPDGILRPHPAASDISREGGPLLPMVGRLQPANQYRSSAT